ncbi:STAS domain-containing protein, partial [Agrobacterium sp.]|uniref:STAS domain-containing protein n=1 Tax=Agrobacterium sp. TaxID=361 RepID=UPI0028AC48A6
MQARENNTDAHLASIASDTDSAGGAERFVLSGDWRNDTITGVLKEISQPAKRSQSGTVEIDLSGIGRVDTAGAWIIQKFRNELGKSGGTVNFTGDNKQVEELIEALPDEAGPPAD